MASVDLSQQLKERGFAFTKDLDAIGLQPQGVMWLHYPHLRDWRLTVVSDLVDEVGRSKVYRLIDEALSHLPPIDGLTIFDVHLAASEEIVPRLFQGGFSLELGVAEIQNASINGLPVDAVLYRMQPPRDRSVRRKAAKRFEATVKRLPEHA